MIDRIVRGRVPAKPHTVFRSEDGRLLYEECLTRQGFEGAFSILYHRHRPHEGQPVPPQHRFRVPVAVDAGGDVQHALLRRHYRCMDIPSPPTLPTAPGASVPTAAPISARVPLLYNRDVVIGFVRPSAADPVYFVNADADDLFFIFQGGGTLRSVFGDLPFREGDYLSVPKGVTHRFVLPAGVTQAWLSIECKAGLALPDRFRNAVGQLRMDAPYSHRDFRKPDLRDDAPKNAQNNAQNNASDSTDDENIRDTVVKRGDEFFGFRSPHPPLDVVGWDGAVYPFAFAISDFQPRVGQIHLPPPVHATFQAGGALICSFVPRPLDFHQAANPCPYPHASVDVDEVLFYANGAFGSRRGVGAGSLSHHPAGVPHGPHPGAYEGSPGKVRTDELAVMLDCSLPLSSTAEARAVEDPEYHASFAEPLVIR